MAGPQRSPRMRDHWRDEAHRREDASYRGRQRERSTDRRSSPVTAKKSERSIDVEVKIKGRASIEGGRRHSTHKQDRDKARKPSPYTERRSSPSLRRRRQREGSYEQRRGADDDHYRHRSHHQESRRQYPDDRRRSRSRSPHRAAAPIYRERQRSPDQHYPRHTDLELNTRARYREPHHSRLSSPRRADYRSVRPEDPSSAGDTYIPSARRPRSRSPAGKRYTEPLLHERRYPVPGSTRSRDAHRSYKEDDLFSNHRSRPREHSPGAIRQPRATSRGRYQKLARPRGSRAQSREISQRPAKRRRSSRSPPGNDGSREEKRMQSTHRIQVLDSTSRPQSPPRPIPSFDTNSQASGSYPMHANRASQLQVNTQHPHSASPQWTPTSSHHGSPQSASPYGHGRGGYSGQPPQYHGQPG